MAADSPTGRWRRPRHWPRSRRPWGVVVVGGPPTWWQKSRPPTTDLAVPESSAARSAAVQPMPSRRAPRLSTPTSSTPCGSAPDRSPGVMRQQYRAADKRSTFILSPVLAAPWGCSCEHETPGTRHDEVARPGRGAALRWCPRRGGAGATGCRARSRRRRCPTGLHRSAGPARGATACRRRWWLRRYSRRAGSRSPR